MGIVPVLHGTVVHGVTLHVADDVLGIVEPVEFGVALGEPGPDQSALHGLCLVEACHIAEGGSGLVEVALLELCLTQQHPRLPKEGVILLAPQPLLVLIGLFLAALPFGLGLDAVATDVLLRLLDGTVVMSAA